MTGLIPSLQELCVRSLNPLDAEEGFPEEGTPEYTELSLTFQNLIQTLPLEGSLMAACTKGSPFLLDVVIAHPDWGAVSDENLVEAFGEACERGYLPIVKKLVGNIPHQVLREVLIWSIEEGKGEITEIVLSSPRSKGISMKGIRMALNLACNQNNRKLVGALLAHPSCIPDVVEEVVLKQVGNPEALEQLISSPRFDPQLFQWVFLAAIEANRLESVRFMIGHGFFDTISDLTVMAALQAADRRGHDDMVELLEPIVVTA